MKDVFVSYSRARRGFADDLVRALSDHNVSFWIDRASIGPAEQWRSALREGILSASHFVVLLDGAWISSTVSQDEYKLAIEYGKTLIPLVVEEVSPAGWKALGLEVPEELASRDYVWSHERKFGAVVKDVVAAVRTDYEWKNLLSRLESRAQGWNTSGGTVGLLRGRELDTVQEKAALAAGKEPAMTAAVAAFIRASEREELKELEAQRERARQAESRSLAGASAESRAEEPIRSLEFAGRAWQSADSVEALRSLGQWFEQHQHLVGAWPSKYPISAVALDVAGQRFASSEFIDAMISGDRPTQRLIIQDLGDLGKIDEQTDIHGFGGCAWAEGKLITLRRQQVLSYRYDLFKEKFRQSTGGVPIPENKAPMIVSPSRSRIAIPCNSNTVLVVYDASSDRCHHFRTEGDCRDAAWVDDSTLLVVEGGGLRRRSIEDWNASSELIPAHHNVVAVDAEGEDWLALSSTGRVHIHRPGPNGVVATRIHQAPDPAVGILLRARSGTAYIYGGGGMSSELGLIEIDIESGQLIHTWLGGFQHAVTSLDVGGDKWLVAGRRDGLVLLWNREASALDTSRFGPPALGATVEAEVIQSGPELQILKARMGEEEVLSAEPSPSSSGFPVLPGRTPCAAKDDTLCVAYGTDLLWYEIGSSSKDPVATGVGHTNPAVHLACSQSNGLWVSAARNALSNALMELYAWDQRSAQPILKLLVPWLDHTGITFDESGEVLLLLQGDTVVRSLVMDPDRWIEHGRAMSRRHWSRPN